MIEHPLLKAIHREFGDSVAPIEIFKELGGGLSGAEIHIVEYSELRRLGVLKIDTINEADSLNKAFHLAEKNKYEKNLAKLVEFCELTDDNNSKKYVYLYELVGDNLRDIKTLFRFLKNESSTIKPIINKIVDFLFKWNLKHDKGKIHPIEIVRNCLVYRLNDKKYNQSFQELNISQSKPYFFLDNTKEFLPNPYYFLSNEDIWKDKNDKQILINTLISVSHGDFHPKNIIVSKNKIHIIDIGQAQDNTNIFYDLLYLELHTLISLLEIETEDQINHWIDLCKVLSSNIRKVIIPEGSRASLLRDFLTTLRKGFNLIVSDERNIRYDNSFNLAGVAVGMNLFRKSKYYNERMAALIYTSFFLKEVLESYGLFSPSIQDAHNLRWDIENNINNNIEIIYDFIGMGEIVSHKHQNEKLRIKKNRFFLDTGNKLTLGAIDLHMSEDGFRIGKEVYKSTTGVIGNSPNFVLDNLDNPSTVEIIVHTMPDFDCFASVYLTKQLITTGKLPNNYEKLVEYVEYVDRGLIQHSDSFIYTPYAIANAIDEAIKKEEKGINEYDLNRRILERGIQLIDFLMNRLTNLAGSHKSIFNPAILYEGSPFDKEFALIENDYIEYLNDRDKLCEEVTLKLPVIDKKNKYEEVKGLIWNQVPNCILHKYWARREGYIFTFIPSEPIQKSFQHLQLAVNKVIISIDPNSKYILYGLGETLEKEECMKETELLGTLKNEWRSREKRRFPEAWCNNEDPWYDGRGYNYTIIDAPRVGSLLTIEEIKKIVIDFYSSYN